MSYEDAYPSQLRPTAPPWSDTPTASFGPLLTTHAQPTQQTEGNKEEQEYTKLFSVFGLPLYHYII